VRLWLMDPESCAVTCVGVGSRHTLSVGSVALSQLSASFFVSVSQDLCLKLWKIPKKLNPGNKCRPTVRILQILNVMLLSLLVNNNLHIKSQHKLLWNFNV
jgi:hypothetical protein